MGSTCAGIAPTTASVAQTPIGPNGAAEQTRIDTYLAQSAGIVTTPQLQPLKYLVVGGYCSKQKGVEGICALEMHMEGGNVSSGSRSGIYFLPEE
jgi:hypothetical protein